MGAGRTWNVCKIVRPVCMDKMLDGKACAGSPITFSIQCVYIEDITLWREDMNFIFEWQNNILRKSAASE